MQVGKKFESFKNIVLYLGFLCFVFCLFFELSLYLNKLGFFLYQHELLSLSIYGFLNEYMLIKILCLLVYLYFLKKSKSLFMILSYSQAKVGGFLTFIYYIFVIYFLYELSFKLNSFLNIFFLQITPESTQSWNFGGSFLNEESFLYVSGLNPYGSLSFFLVCFILLLLLNFFIYFKNTLASIAYILIFIQLAVKLFEFILNSLA